MKGDRFRISFDELTTQFLAAYEVFDRAIAGIAMIASLAEAAADKTDQDKMTGRRNELHRDAKSITRISHLFVACNETYKLATGKEPGGSRKGNIPTGPCVRFYDELLKRARSRMPPEISELHPDLMKALTKPSGGILMCIQRAKLEGAKRPSANGPLADRPLADIRKSTL